MAKSKPANNFFVFFLILSFLLISIAAIPLCMDTSSDYGTDKADLQFSVSQVIPDSLDYKASESLIFKFSFRQAVRVKLLNMVICPADLLIPSITASGVSLGFFLHEIYRQSISIRIADYLHAKDGMI